MNGLTLHKLALFAVWAPRISRSQLYITQYSFPRLQSVYKWAIRGIAHDIFHAIEQYPAILEHYKIRPLPVLLNAFLGLSKPPIANLYFVLCKIKT